VPEEFQYDPVSVRGPQPTARDQVVHYRVHRAVRIHGEYDHIAQLGTGRSFKRYRATKQRSCGSSMVILECSLLLQYALQTYVAIQLARQPDMTPL